METATIWHEETQARYEDAEVRQAMAEARADEYWDDAAAIEGILQDVEVPHLIIPHLMTLRQWNESGQRVGTGIAMGAASKIVDIFEDMIIKHVLENEEL